MTKADSLRRRSILLLASAAAFGFALGHGRAQARAEPAVLFICEHGYAKSLVAALHFQRMAALRGVATQALSRGVDPGAAVPASIEAGLAADGFDIRGFVPRCPTREEINDAAYVVLIAVDADVSQRAGPVLRWDAISPLSENYNRARSEIVDLAAALLDRIQAEAHARPAGRISSTAA